MSASDSFRSPASPTSTARLDFRHNEAAEEPVRNDISVLEHHGNTLWLASDETASIERLIAVESGVFAEHRSFSLHDFIDLPDDASEADIEGLSADSGYLWLVGSHALKRKKPKPKEKGREEALERLKRVICEPNRYLLARIPLVVGEREGVYSLVAKADDRTVAVVKMRDGRNELAELLDDDVHFGPFMQAPAKENGFDIEGLAVRGDSVFLGLRGPVLVGYAVIIELRVEATSKGRLKLKKIGPNGARYRKHFLHLNGLGIRELHFEGDALLILAGPTMDLDGPVRVYRWSHPLDAENQQIIAKGDVEQVIELPFGDGTDHAEGIAVVDDDARPSRLLVAYDSPDPSRLHDNTAIDVDVFTLP